jgi:hypothetical protein
MLNVKVQDLENDLDCGRIWTAFERRRSVSSMMFGWMEVLTRLVEGREKSSWISRRTRKARGLK